MSDPTLQFLGAAGTVTGSRFLLGLNGAKVLVDCGLFQGLKELRLRNWEKLPVEPSEIDAVVLTHAHIDHTGYLPRLVKQGFAGTVYCSPATAELAALLLPDSGHLQEEEAKFANKKGYSKHSPALPLYTKLDAVESLRRLDPLPYGEERELAEGIRAVLHPSGHILGAAFAELRCAGRRVIFSGDIGGYDCEVMRGPADLPGGVDALLVESTYGGRRQVNLPIQDQLHEKIAPVLQRGGVVVIPAFAVGRTTLVLYHLRRLEEAGAIPKVPVYVDSPMAADAVKLYAKYGDEHNLRAVARGGALRTGSTFLVRSPQDSKRINDETGPMVIIAASGMATGGRILHHLKHRLPDPKNLVLLVGYQAQGTRGRALLEGAKQLKIHGEAVPVRASVGAINGLSAHGDSDEIIRWLGTARAKPKKTFLVHGEEEGLRAMAGRVGSELGLAHAVPRYLEEVAL